MRPITVIRAILCASIAVTAWGSASPWGEELGIGNGPPSQYERQLVGAALLLVVALIAMALTARQGTKPGRFALAVAAAGSLGAVALTLSVRSAALAHDQGHVLLGGGWTWMAVGACLGLGAVGSAIALRLRKAPPTATKVAKGGARGPGKGSVKGAKKKRA